MIVRSTKCNQNPFSNSHRTMKNANRMAIRYFAKRDKMKASSTLNAPVINYIEERIGIWRMESILLHGIERKKIKNGNGYIEASSRFGMKYYWIDECFN